MTTSKIHLIIRSFRNLYDQGIPDEGIVASSSKDRAEELAKKLNEFVEFSRDFDNKLYEFDTIYRQYNGVADYNAYQEAKKKWLRANYIVPKHLREIIKYDAAAKRLDHNIMEVWSHNSYYDGIYSVQEVEMEIEDETQYND